MDKNYKEMGGEIVYLTDRKQFWKYMNKHPFIILKATATWCKPCQKMKPLLDDLFHQMPETVVLIILDIDKGSNLASYLKIKNVPMLMNFINGDPQDCMKGADIDDIMKFFNKTLERVNA